MSPESLTPLTEEDDENIYGDITFTVYHTLVDPTPEDAGREWTNI